MNCDMFLYKRVWHPCPKIIQVGTWRRAYSIHEFLMNHCKNDTKGLEHRISWKIIKKLRELCNLVLAHQNQEDFEAMALKYLPNEFGDYGEYFKVYLADTIRIIDRLGFNNENEHLIYKKGV